LHGLKLLCVFAKNFIQSVLKIVTRVTYCSLTSHLSDKLTFNLGVIKVIRVICEAYSAEWHAIAYDRAQTGYLFASRVITNDSFLSNQNNSKFLVFENGFQFLVRRDVIYLKEHLVFSDSNDNILFQRIFDTKRLDGQGTCAMHSRVYTLRLL